jgi:hypothetical protein
MGLSPCDSETSGAANQNSVSVCADRNVVTSNRQVKNSQKFKRFFIGLGNVQVYEIVIKTHSPKNKIFLLV